MARTPYVPKGQTLRKSLALSRLTNAGYGSVGSSPDVPVWRDGAHPNGRDCHALGSAHPDRASKKPSDDGRARGTYLAKLPNPTWQSFPVPFSSWRVGGDPLARMTRPINATNTPAPVVRPVQLDVNLFAASSMACEITPAPIRTAPARTTTAPESIRIACLPQLRNLPPNNKLSSGRRPSEVRRSRNQEGGGRLLLRLVRRLPPRLCPGPLLEHGPQEIAQPKQPADGACNHQVTDQAPQVVPPVG